MERMEKSNWVGVTMATRTETKWAGPAHQRRQQLIN